MPAVDLPVANESLPYYEATRHHIGGQELERRPDPSRPNVTLVTLDMDEAPAQAATMEITLERVRHKGTRILRTTYYDPEGRQLSVIERHDDTGWIERP